MTQKELVKLAVERINNILKYESDTIQSCFATDNDEIVVELSNGMNLNLSQSEVEYRADQQVEERRVEMERYQVVNALTFKYIDIVKDDTAHNDFLRKLIRGNATPLNMMGDERLCAEYEKYFDKHIIIMK